MTTPPVDVHAVMDDAVATALASVAPADAPPADASPADAAAAEAVTAALDAMPAEAEETPVDAAETTPAEAEAEPEAEAEGEAEGEAPTLPEGFVAVPAVTDGLATEFRLLDEEGEVEVPALVVEYKANGKVRKDRLDQVVKLAQWGVYNQERDTKAQQIEQQAQQVQQEREELASVLAEREQQIERLLTDDDFLLAVREAYERENAPEKQVARAQEQVEALKVQYAMEQIAQQATTFVESQVQPALQMIAEALPDVTVDELAERMQYAMQAHVVRAPNGQPYVPPESYDAVRKYIVEDLAIWAQIQQDRRVSARAPRPAPAAVPAAPASDPQAQIDAQKAKRAIAQTLRPVGKAGDPRAVPTKQAPPATIDDAVDSALEAVLASLR